MADAQLTRFESMTNVELRAELKQRGCPTSGNKKDLLAKLRVALEKEYEQNTHHHSVGYHPQVNLPIHDQANVQYPSLYNSTVAQNTYPVIPISRQLPISPSGGYQQYLPMNIPQVDVVSSTPERRPRTRSKKLSVDSSTNEISNTTSINNEEIVLDISNNVEVNSFVSKSNEEEEKNIEKIIEETHLPSLDSNSAKSEGIIKEIPLSDEQSETITNQSSKSVPTKQEEITKEDESSSINNESEKPPVKPNRSQIKFLTRSTTNKINLSIELLKTLITDLTLAHESILHDELDSDQNNESILETDFVPSDSITIGELADQKQQTNRTVAIDDLSTKNKPPARIPSFESKTLVDGKSNNIVTDEPVRIKDVTTTNEPPSQILYIRGLTRPFSLMQLKGLLSRYGTLIDGEFWLDKIKSQCFVTYKTLEEAQNAREALDGCRWPSTNPKTLLVRFGRQEEFEFSKTHDLPPDHMSTDSTDRVIEEKPTSPVNGIESKNSSDELKLQKEKQSGFLITEEEEEEPVKPNEQSMKGLDDYFRKTKTKPSIYWLPLTEEQIIERARRQEQRNAERDEELKKRAIDENVPKPEKRKHSSSPSRQDLKRH